MDFLKKIDWTPLNILKAVGLLLLVLFVLGLIARTFDVDKTPFRSYQDTISNSAIAPMMRTFGGDDGYDMEESAYYGEAKLSLDNIGVPVPQPGYSSGADAEDYEVTNYSASIETRDSSRTCAGLLELKKLDHVIFDSANESERSCYIRFKVEREKAGEILEVIKNLNPKDLSESTYTIKNQITDFSSELEILQAKLDSIDKTLSDAITAYDEITTLATRTNDAESLAKIINSKISTIERLTQQKINITAQMERLVRSKAEQLDRLEYVYFDVSVYENKFVDGEQVKDSWKNSVKDAVRNVNKTAQDVTINLIVVLFLAAQYVLYFLIGLLILKYLWGVTKTIWKK